MLKKLRRKVYRVHHHKDKAGKRKSYDVLPAREQCHRPREDTSPTESGERRLRRHGMELGRIELIEIVLDDRGVRVEDARKDSMKVVEIEKATGSYIHEGMYVNLSLKGQA
jgi:hypothetical protein